MTQAEKILVGVVIVLVCLTGYAFGKTGSSSVGFVSDSGYPTTLTNLGLTGNLEVNGNIVEGGVGTLENLNASASSTYNMTAAEACQYSSFNITATGSVTLNLPATTTFLAACLPNVGQYDDDIFNSISSSTTFAAGSGGTLGYTSSSTVATGKYGIMRILHDATSTYKAYLINVPN